jgi:hypothetical protein
MYDVTISDSTVSHFPEVVEEHPEAYLAIRHFLKHRKGSLVTRLIRYIKEKMT